MRYSSNAPAIAYAALGTKLFVLGAVLLLIAGCLLGIGHLIIELFSPIATEPSGVLTVHGNYVAAAIALGAIGGIAVIAGIAINSKLPASKKLRQYHSSHIQRNIFRVDALPVHGVMASTEGELEINRRDQFGFNARDSCHKRGFR